MWKPKSINPFLLCFALCLGVALFSFWQIINWYQSVSASNEILNEVRSSAVIVDSVVTPLNGASFQSDPQPAPSPYLSVNFTELKQRNNDIMAWLKLDSAKIDMPIVQTTDNAFYLTHNLDKKSSNLGWVFADVRSNIEHLGFNTVLYGHNAVSGQMFGSLKSLLHTDFIVDPEAKFLQFTTPTQKMRFEIVSVFKTDDSDYKYTSQVFIDEAEREAFVQYIQHKNLVATLAQSTLSPIDTFLTLSTCHGRAGTSNRLAIVAKLISVES
jgi:sortase B